MILPTKEFWDKFKETPGALSCSEALAIIQIAALVPSGNYMCLGAHKGKDSIAAAQTLKAGRFYLIEPEFEDKWWAMETGALVMNQNSDLQVELVVGYSTDVIGNYSPYSYVFSDAGSHSDEIPMQEVKLLEDRMVQGGIIAFHDVFSQFIKQTEAYEYLIGTGKYDKIEINWQEIFDYVKEHNLEEGNNSWHQYPDLPHPPNFVGALRRK